MTQIEVTMLGTTAGIPTKYRNQPAIYLRYVSENEFCMLFDCGEATQRQIFSAGLNFMRLDYIFITHWHADHFAGLLGLLQTMSLEGRTRPVTVFAPEADKFLEMLLDLGYSTRGLEVIEKNVEFEGSEIETLLSTDEFKVMAVPVKHSVPAVAYAFVENDRVKISKDKAKTLGLPDKGPIYKKIKDEGSVMFKDKNIRLEEIASVERGKKVVYSGDTEPCENMIKLAACADLLIHDTTYFENFERKHATLDDVVKIAEEAKARKVVLTHISRRYNAAELKEMIKGYPNFVVAKDFMKIVIR